MNNFYEQLLARQTKVEAIPANKTIATWALAVLDIVYPERANRLYLTVAEIGDAFNGLKDQLVSILDATKACKTCNNQDIANRFFGNLPQLYNKLNTDLEALLGGDPAACNEFEIIRCYPGFLAVCLYRIAHQLLKLGVPIIPRVLTEYAHSVTGVDIHPGAEIGEYFFIDHGTGIVIGETTVIGNRVKLYQGVTLGALSVQKVFANTKRHPTIGDNVVIYAGATILGGETIIGDNCIVGGNVWLTKSLPANSTAYHQPTIKITEAKTESE